MSWFSGTQLDSLDTLFRDQIEDLYDAEQRLVDALPNMADASSSPQLKQAFESHLQETRNHVSRLERIFHALGQEAESKTCQAMKGLVKEGQEAIDAEGDPNVKDAALIAAAQRVEHYEIAAYGTARTFARQLNLGEIASILDRLWKKKKPRIKS